MRNVSLSNNPFEWSQFLDLIYGMHEKAYAECCCPGTIAPKITWEAIFFLGKYLSVACDTWPIGETSSILEFGRCGCGW
jgi:hypothetical protein